MKNMESDRSYQQAIRGSSRPQLLNDSSPDDKPPCVEVVEKPNQVSIRVRLPDGSQTIIKINSDATVSLILYILLILIQVVASSSIYMYKIPIDKPVFEVDLVIT